MWTCPKCGTKVDPSFEVCWACGTTQEGVEDPTFRLADAPPTAGSPEEESPLDLDMPVGDAPLPEPSTSGANTKLGAFASYRATAAMAARSDLSQDTPKCGMIRLHRASGSSR